MTGAEIMPFLVGGPILLVLLVAMWVVAIAFVVSTVKWLWTVVIKGDL